MDDRARRRALTGLLAVGVVPFLLNGWINSYIYDEPPLYWGFELLTWLALPAGVFALAKHKTGLRADDLDLSATIAGKRSIPWVLVTALLLCPIAYQYFRWVRYFAQSIVPDPGYFTYILQVLAQDSLPRPLVGAYYALTAGIVEELYFRALMLRICQHYARPVLLYLLASPMLFALIHWENGVDDMLYAWAVGLLFALLYVKWRNLWPLMAAHAYVDYVNFS